MGGFNLRGTFMACGAIEAVVTTRSAQKYLFISKQGLIQAPLWKRGGGEIY
jgi:hypothetical protein